MAQIQRTINPYPALGSEFSQGLNQIIAAIPQNPTVDQLVTQAQSFVRTLYYPDNDSIQLVNELLSVGYNAINSYNNNLVITGNATYNTAQSLFLQLLIGKSMTAGIEPDCFADRLADIEDNIGVSELTVSEQVPLFFATKLGSAANAYWISQLPPIAGPWSSHFSTNAGQNYLNVMVWSVAAMNGALSAYGATSEGLIAPTTDIVTTQMVSALMGALVVSAGKLLFNWAPRITKPLQFNVERVTDLQNAITSVNPNVNPGVHKGFLSIGHACSERNECRRLSYDHNGTCGNM